MNQTYYLFSAEVSTLVRNESGYSQKVSFSNGFEFKADYETFWLELQKALVKSGTFKADAFQGQYIMSVNVSDTPIQHGSLEEIENYINEEYLDPDVELVPRGCTNYVLYKESRRPPLFLMGLSSIGVAYSVNNGYPTFGTLLFIGILAISLMLIHRQSIETYE